MSTTAGNPVDGQSTGIRTEQEEEKNNKAKQYKSFVGEIRGQLEPALLADLSHSEIRQQLCEYPGQSQQK